MLSTLTCNDISVSIFHSVLIFLSRIPRCRLSFKETLKKGRKRQLEKHEPTVALWRKPRRKASGTGQVLLLKCYLTDAFVEQNHDSLFKWYLYTDPDVLDLCYPASLHASHTPMKTKELRWTWGCSALESLQFLGAELHPVLTRFTFDVSTSFSYLLANDLMDLNIYRHENKNLDSTSMRLFFFGQNLSHHQDDYFVRE